MIDDSAEVVVYQVCKRALISGLFLARIGARYLEGYHSCVHTLLAM